jgi:hypothetical protein
MSRNQNRYRIALLAAGLLLPLAAGPATAHPDSGDLSASTAATTYWGPPVGRSPWMPGDLWLWENGHPFGASPAPLPGDVRAWENAHPFGGSPAPLPHRPRVWEPGQPGGM